VHRSPIHLNSYSRVESKFSVRRLSVNHNPLHHEVRRGKLEGQHRDTGAMVEGKFIPVVMVWIRDDALQAFN